MARRLHSTRRWRSLVPATAMIALTLALAVPIAHTALGRVGGYDVAKAVWNAICQPSEAKSVGVVAEARAIYRPVVRASLGPQSLGPVVAAPMAAFPVSTAPAPLISR
ncbi:MAG: hypothetical protein EPO67_04540 [Reyranella sp.]|nr:MAG: hypothetical protein EPO67_04540 [Reyranella sp.]